MSDRDDSEPNRLLPSKTVIARLLPMAGKTRRLLLPTFLLLMVGSGIQVVLPQIIKIAIDGPLSAAGIKEPNLALDRVDLLALSYVGLLLVSSLTSYLAALLLQRFGQSLVLTLRHQLFAKLHRLPISYFDQNAVGRTVSRVVNDTNALSELFTSVLVSGLSDILLVSGVFLVLLFTNPVLGVILFAFCPLMIALVVWFRSRSAPLYKTQRGIVASINSFLGETFEGLSTVKTFHAEHFLQERFAGLNQRCLDNEIALIRRISYFRPTFAVAQTAATALLLTIGGLSVIAGHLSIGTLVASLLYVQLLFSPLEELAERYNILVRATVASERVLEVLDLGEEHSGETPPLPSGEIRFDNVSYFYSPDKPVLKNVSFTISPGETVALVGPTGSGKSTIVSLLLGFYPLRDQVGHSGTISYGGVPLADLDVLAWRRRLAYVSQELFVFKNSVRGNIRLFEDHPNKAVEQAAEDAGMSRLLGDLPLGLETPIGEKGHALSTGQRQLLSFARALVFDPEFLVLDEATANIDSETEAQLEIILDKLLQGRQAVIVAHRLATVRRANTIIVLSQGQIVEKGSHQDLMRVGGMYAEMVRKAESQHQAEKEQD